MPVVYRHGVFRSAEDSRLVHIVPHAIDAGGHEILVERSPPAAHIRPCEIGEVAGTRPHIAHERFSVLVLHPIVAEGALVVDEVAFLRLYARVDHIDRLEMVLVEIVVEPFGVGELLRVEGEDTVAIHIVDVHPDDIGRNFVFPQFVGNLHDLRIRLVAEAALLIAQCPQRRQLHGAGEVDERLHELPGAVALDDDDAEGRSLTFEGHLMVERGDGLAPRIVGDDAESRAIGPDAHDPGMTLIEMRPTVDAIGRRIDVPEAHGASVAA